MQKILVIQTNSASQLMLDTALFRCMKLQIHTLELHLVTDAAFVHLVENNQYLDQVFSYSNNLKSLQADFHLHGYDSIVDLQNDLISQALISGLEAEHYYAKAPGFVKKLFSGFKPYPNRINHVFAIAKDLRLHYDGNGPDFTIPKEEIVLAADIPTSHSAGYVCILLGHKVDSNALKIVCERINHPIILLGTENDKDAGENIAATDAVKIYNAAGKFSFNETADLIRNAKLLVAELNEYLYIAVAFHVSSIALVSHKKECNDLQNAYSRTAQTKTKGPLFLYDTDFIKKQRTLELGDKIQRMISGM